MEKSFAAEQNDRQLLSQIEAACRFMLDAYGDAGENERALIVGALRYCFIADDAISDEAFAAGYLDDVKVINHVLEKLGVLDKCIKFHGR